MSLSSHPFPFGNRLEIPLGFATPEAQSTCRWSRGSAAVSLSGSATPPASLRTLLCQEKKLCKPVPGSQLGLDPGHNQLQSQSLPQSLHTIIYNIMPFHTYEQHGTATCKHLMLHGSWKQATDLHCFLQSNCRLQKNSADSAWRTHFRAYYALSKDAASSPSEKKWIWRWNWRVAPFVQSWHPCHAL